MALAILLSPVFFIILSNGVSAQDLTQRSITIRDPKASANTSHRYNFFNPTASNVGSIVFEYCSNSPLLEVACNSPAGLDVSAASITSQSGETGFTVHANTNANRLVLSRVPSVAAIQAVEYRLGNIINPSAQNATVYVRIATYSADDGTGAAVDNGSVAFSTTTGVSTIAYVPPYLTFCVGISVAPDCSSTTDNRIDMGVLSTSTTSVGTSQFAGASNDPTGFSTTLMGLTMTSGNNTITAAETPTASVIGTSQFGLNLRQNNIPSGGLNSTGPGSSAPRNGYGSTNLFKFVPGEIVASSPVSTDFNVFTATYIVNISDNQPPGIYVTTITYVATASF